MNVFVFQKASNYIYLSPMKKCGYEFYVSVCLVGCVSGITALERMDERPLAIGHDSYTGVNLN